ncbi:FAD/NAD(P)-binding protein [Brucella intermedia]|uniref:FAD/NAD(P)-binding protein n=1 Tax=Brucella intermedia TaxID=94625 RepID=UPI0023613178|nr:FAD/NAD(P)-binding protein [Brucella intermedia]
MYLLSSGHNKSGLSAMGREPDMLPDTRANLRKSSTSGNGRIMQDFDHEQTRVAVVGGGASGVTTFIALVRYRAARTIFIIEPGPVGRATGFCTSDDDLICNTSVDVMSVIPENHHDFLDYLKSQNYSVSITSYVPRSWFNAYLADRYQRYREIAQQNGIEVVHLPCRFQSLRVEGHRRYQLRLAGHASEPLIVSDVIFCTGYGSPRIPDLLAPHQNNQTFISSPYPEEVMLAKTGRKSRVLVVGSKLSGVDAAILLCREGHQVTMLSPSGRLPAVRTCCVRKEHVMWDPNQVAALLRESMFQDPSSLTNYLFKHVVHALAKHSALPWKRQFSCATSPEERLLEETAIAERGESHWQDLIVTFMDALNTVYARNREELLGRLPASFLTTLYPYFAAIALPNAQKLSRYVDTGVLKIKKGTMVRVVPPHRNDPWLVDWRDGPQPFDAIVACSGFSNGNYIFRAGELTSDVGRYEQHEIVDVAPDMSADHPRFERKESIWFVGVPAHLRLIVPNAFFIIAPRAVQVVTNMLSLARPESREWQSEATML